MGSGGNSSGIQLKRVQRLNSQFLGFNHGRPGTVFQAEGLDLIPSSCPKQEATLSLMHFLIHCHFSHYFATTRHSSLSVGFLSFCETRNS
jgi:hypothetical protein